MAERPGFRPRPSSPMVSPALSEGGDGRREGIRRELWDRLANKGQHAAPTRTFVGNPENPDAMPVRMGVGPDGQPLPGGPGEMGGSDEVMSLIQQVMGPDIVGAPPEFIQDFQRVLTRLKSEGWPMTAATAQKVRGELLKGKSVDQICYEYRTSMGG
jgi:hypothetical protein